MAAIGNSICCGMKNIHYLNVRLLWFSSLKGLVQPVEGLPGLEEFSEHVTNVSSPCFDFEGTVAELRSNINIGDSKSPL